MLNIPNKKEFRYTPDIIGYQKALWDFLLEHSEIEENGKIFIKFHTDDQRNFNNRVLARWKYNYHREDVEQKAKRLEQQKENYREKKKLKKLKYKVEKRERKRLLLNNGIYEKSNTTPGDILPTIQS